ncbi:MAG: hypothetical protein QXV06_07390 [Ignisphaera sp.]
MLRKYGKQYPFEKINCTPTSHNELLKHMDTIAADLTLHIKAVVPHKY